MTVEKIGVVKLRLTELKALDPVCVFAEDFSPSHGQITITCYGKAWTSYWGGMGDKTIAQFFCSCDEHYIAKNLSTISTDICDIDAIQEQAGQKGIECHRDDPWNDYDFLEKMYGPNMMDWFDSLPKKPNHEYVYLCRIIKAVQEGFKAEGLA